MTIAAKWRIERPVKRSSDLDTIKELFSVFPRPLVDDLLQGAARDQIQVDHLDVLESAYAMVREAHFHLYDTQLVTHLKKFFYEWEMVWDLGAQTHHDYNFDSVATLITNEFDQPPESYDVYLKHVAEAQTALRKLNACLRETFPDFNVKESDTRAMKRYFERKN